MKSLLFFDPILFSNYSTVNNRQNTSFCLLMLCCESSLGDGDDDISDNDTLLQTISTVS